ncbi:MAG: hypothetical protein LBE97_00250 [Holosporales bacterium]|nr:hypothetical protein [Holosporales bacterium]
MKLLIRIFTVILYFIANQSIAREGIVNYWATNANPALLTRILPDGSVYRDTIAATAASCNAAIRGDSFKPFPNPVCYTPQYWNYLILSQFIWKVIQNNAQASDEGLRAVYNELMGMPQYSRYQQQLSIAYYDDIAHCQLMNLHQLLANITQYQPPPAVYSQPATQPPPQVPANGQGGPHHHHRHCPGPGGHGFGGPGFGPPPGGPPPFPQGGPPHGHGGPHRHHQHGPRMGPPPGGHPQHGHGGHGGHGGPPWGRGGRGGHR